MPSFVQTLAVWALPVLFAITLHEVAHGWVARALGDNTAAAQGRLSLNPLRHIDPVGTLLVPALFLLIPGGFGFLFGWAKPVPVNARNLRHPKRDMAVVAGAGPLANLAMALLWAVLLRIALGQGAQDGLWLGVELMAKAGIAINLMLMALNLLPLPPLDGGRVLSGLLPARWSWQLDKVEPYGFIILLALMFLKVLGPILMPLYLLGQSVVLGVVGLA